MLKLDYVGKSFEELRDDEKQEIFDTAEYTNEVGDIVADVSACVSIAAKLTGGEYENELIIDDNAVFYKTCDVDCDMLYTEFNNQKLTIDELEDLECSELVEISKNYGVSGKYIGYNWYAIVLADGTELDVYCR